MRRRFSYPDGNGDTHRNTDADTYGYGDSDSYCYSDSHSDCEADTNTQISTYTKGPAHSSTATLRMKRLLSR